MQREIKFRGFSTYYYQWFTGAFINHPEQGATIMYHVGANESKSIRVYAESVGEFTGKVDKAGKEIYEGDWCRACFRDKDGFHYVQGPVFMDEFMWCLEAQGSVMNGEIFSINRLHDWEVLGNKQENPELWGASETPVTA